MIKKVAVFAPHPDDETLGCGATLLKLMASGCQVTWILGTEAGDTRYDAQCARNELVSKSYPFERLIHLHIKSTTVDQLPFSSLVNRVKEALDEAQAEILFLPFSNDAHTDHQVLTRAALSCCKAFRNPTVKHILFYETPSETDFQLDPQCTPFYPNMYVDVTDYFPRKKELLLLYKEELGQPPFPRSFENVEALATLRGSQCGKRYAEAFQLVRGVF